MTDRVADTTDGASLAVAFGTEARCTDGLGGVVSRVVVDPGTLTVTHLVVEPPHRRGLGRLVPLDLVQGGTDAIRLTCTVAELDGLPHAEESEFLPASGGHVDYPVATPLPQPFEGLGDVIGDVPETITYDTPPPGELELRPGQEVDAVDGVVGSVEGVVIGLPRRIVTHVVVEGGHAWRHTHIDVPVDAVTFSGGGIRVGVSMQEVMEASASGAGPPAG